jgi:hypothetical protein
MDKSDAQDEQIRILSYNWFRNELGNDYSIRHEISVGETIAPIVWQGMANLTYEYNCSNRIDSQNYSLPSDCSRISLIVAEKLQKSIIWQEEIGHFHGEETDFLPVGIKHKLAVGVIRTVQLVVRKKLINKLLCIDSRMTRHLNFGRRTIRLYRRSILSGAFPVIRNSSRKQHEIALPKNISYLNVEIKLKHINQRFPSPFDDVLIELFASYIEQKYVEMRDGIIESIIFSESILNFYKPKSVLLPADGYPSFIIYAQKCKSMGIETIGAVDGYPLISIFPISKEHNSEHWLLDKFVAFSEKHREDLVGLGFPIEKTIICEPPFKRLRVTGEKLYDCLIFTWFPNVFSCTSDHTSPPNTLMSALRAVINSGALNIGIKIKADIEIEYVEKVISGLESKVNIDVLQGGSITHLLHCEYAVGGISTAATEASMNGIPYFIFEPYENGYSDYWLSKSSVLNPLSVSRSAEHLGEAVLKRHSKN